MKNFIFVLFSLIIIFTSCVSKYTPVASPTVEISGDFAVINLPNSIIAVSESSWGYEPQYLPNYYTTMFVRIHNKSSHVLSVTPADFALINENSIQHDAYANDVVLDMVLNDPSLIPDRFAIAVETQRENSARINEIRRNILVRGFTYGDLHPGAIKEGVLFFQRLDSKNREFKFIYKGSEVEFKKGNQN